MKLLTGLMILEDAGTPVPGWDRRRPWSTILRMMVVGTEADRFWKWELEENAHAILARTTPVERVLGGDALVGGNTIGGVSVGAESLAAEAASATELDRLARPTPAPRLPAGWEARPVDARGKRTLPRAGCGSDRRVTARRRRHGRHTSIPGPVRDR